MNYASRWRFVAGALLLLMVFCGAIFGVYLIFGQMKDADRGKLLLEASKTLFEIMTALIVGVFIAGVAKSFVESKRADKSLHDFRVGFLNELQASYQRVKKSRRALRAYG